jgi:deazaflavin-dependent oxidoreductase (nitroreductase family)
MADWNSGIIDEFRANGGKVGGPFEGSPLLLLHTKGAKTGAERVNPVMYRPEGGALAIFASKAGAPENPDWYYNLLANPVVTVEVGTQTRDMVARVAKGEERERIWTAHKKAAPGFAEYEAKTTRQIPVIILEPVS